jgi:hypothetical protein
VTASNEAREPADGRNSAVVEALARTSPIAVSATITPGLLVRMVLMARSGSTLMH